MHELGIASAILESVQAEAQKRPEGRITKVGVESASSRRSTSTLCSSASR